MNPIIAPIIRRIISSFFLFMKVDLSFLFIRLIFDRYPVEKRKQKILKIKGKKTKDRKDILLEKIFCMRSLGMYKRIKKMLRKITKRGNVNNLLNGNFFLLRIALIL